MIVIGIDPGLNGAIARINGSESSVWDLPTMTVDRNGKARRAINPDALARMLKDIVGIQRDGDAVVCVERAQSSSQMGVTSSFNYGSGYGLIIGVLAAIAVPRKTVPPATWKRAMGLIQHGTPKIGRAKAGSKHTALELARRLYPALAAQLSREGDHNRAEAVLIAHYACEEHEGGALFRGEPAIAPKSQLTQMDF